MFSTCLENFLPFSSYRLMARYIYVGVYEYLWSKGLTHSTQRHLLTPLGNRPFENTVGKGEIACNKQFLLFPQCFLSVWRAICHFHQTCNCCLQTFLVWKSQVAGSFGLYQEENATDRRDWNRKVNRTNFRN